MGTSCSQLQAARSAQAQAAATGTVGQNPDVVLYVLDGPSGTLDPAFDAHVNVIKSWALAYWEAWVPEGFLAKCHRAARLRLNAAKSSTWRAVAGPTAATIATLARLGWTTTDPTKTTDDVGFTWDFRLDSPAAIVQACKASVRRWRLARIAALIPGLLPETCDIGTPEGPSMRTVTIDFISALTPLLKGKTSTKKLGQTWDNAWRGDAKSAMTGSQ